MRWRDIVSIASASAITFAPSVACAQPLPVIGFLHAGSPAAFVHPLAAFHGGLKAGGYVAGQNVAIEYRWAEGRPERLPEMAANLVRRDVSVIAAMGGNLPAQGAKAATKTIPIVFNTGADPVAAGLVPSLSRPDGNVTGVSFLIEQLGSKGLGLLHELVPHIKKIGVLINPRNPGAQSQESNAREAALTLGVELEVVYAATPPEIDKALEDLVARKAGALLTSGDPVFGNNMSRVIEFSNRNKIPTMYFRREFAEAGGLVSYGTSATEAYSKVGEYVARVLKGAKPVDLPVSQVVKFEFVLNLKTAKELGIEVPPALSARADDIIE